MKLLFVLASLLAVAQAQFSIGAPTSGATLQAGQNMIVQIIVPIDTSPEAGEDEVSLVIGIVACGSSACPAPSADLGEILFIGKFQGQGEVGDTLNLFENFTLVIPSDISGSASIQVQHAFLLTPPGHAFPTVEYTSVAVDVSSALNVHPNGDNSKCIDILRAHADGMAVDIFDCNESNTPSLRIPVMTNDDALISVNPADRSQWCVDAGGVQSQCGRMVSK